MCKFIFITGGVVSGLGKGIVSASIGRILKCRGLRVASQKLDPYINVDPGTMSPYQHGEVFVTEDGAETDLDLGHYERFIDADMNRLSNLTTGKVLWNVLRKEREGGYNGKTVQIIPHVTDEIKSFIYAAAKQSDPDVLLVEVGGTVGDIESQPFLEAIRQIGLEVGLDNALYVHVTLVPYLECSKEHKSKPTQHSVKELQGMGIKPNIIILRSSHRLEKEIFAKIALFCNIEEECVIENRTIPILYEVPLRLEKQHLGDIVCKKLGIASRQSDMAEWKALVEAIKSPSRTLKVGIVGKYVKFHDCYLSLIEAIKHAGYALSCRIELHWIDAETLDEDNVADKLSPVDALIVPGGFGNRGIEGMIVAAKHCRENKIPYLGICLGMQIAVIEFARNVAKLSHANSREFDPSTPYPVIDFLPDQSADIALGGTLRLGAYPCLLVRGSKIEECYQKDLISERHRHRYEFNNAYRDSLEKSGLILSGLSPDGRIVETVETANPFYIGVQFHPEFKSRPTHPHPLFVGLLQACKK
ncbi:MAG: CTP synthase [Bacilli bacterium]|nr:CTP synthase [Bacilli bacterium]